MTKKLQTVRNDEETLRLSGQRLTFLYHDLSLRFLNGPPYGPVFQR